MGYTTGDGYQAGKGEMLRRVDARWKDITVARLTENNTLRFNGTCRATGRRAHVTTFHWTDVRVYWETGYVTLDNGGYNTLTTRARMGTSTGWGYMWFQDIPFVQRMTVFVDGRVETDVAPELDAQLRAKHRAYWARADQVTVDSVDFFIWVYKKIGALPRGKQRERWEWFEAGLAAPQRGGLIRYIRAFVREGGKL